MGRNWEATNQPTKSIQIMKEIESDNFCFHKVRKKNLIGAREKRQMLLSQYWLDYHFYSAPKIISYF